MTSPMRKTVVFAGSCLLSAAGWALFWPAPPRLSPVAAPPPAASLGKEPPWRPENLQGLIDGVAKAPDAASRLEACRLLSAIPLADIPEALEMVPLGQDRELSLIAKVLLIRWAGSDGEAAAKWAWQHFRKASMQTGTNIILHDNVWDEAFGQIAAAWAYHNPKDFGRWLLERISSRPGSSLDDPTEEQMRASAQPILSSDMEEKAILCLLGIEPRLAFEALVKRHVFSTGNDEFAKSLETVGQVREALSAFDHLQDIKADAYTGEDGFALSLLGRWKELDPKDFAGSPYRKVIENPALYQRFEPWADLPQEDRRAAVEELTTQATDPKREPGVAYAVAKWAEADAAACGEWLAASPQKNSGPVMISYLSGLATVDLGQALERIEELPMVARQRALASSFAAWMDRHPDLQPDVTGWSEEETEAWKDLAALRETAKKPQ